MPSTEGVDAPEYPAPRRGDGGETAVNDAAQSVEQRGELILCQRREEGVKGTQIQRVGESAEQVTEQAAALDGR